MSTRENIRLIARAPLGWSFHMVKNLTMAIRPIYWDGVHSVWLHLNSFSLFTLAVQMLMLMKQYKF